MYLLQQMSGAAGEVPLLAVNRLQLLESHTSAAILADLRYKYMEMPRLIKKSSLRNPNTHNSY